MKFEYCVAIRTLGTAGDKYYQTLLSLKQQTIPPKKILVYIAEGYPLPKETIGIEQYVYVKKGMIAQRALPYKEVDTEYILLLDDDLYLAPDAVERMYNGMTNNSGDVMCANVFPNHEASFSEKLRWIFFVGTFPMKSNKWAFKIRKNGNYSYNNDPKNGIYESQSAAGPCSLWKLDVFKSVHFEDEAYFDKFRYPIGEDQLLFNKAYQRGWKVLVDYNLPVQHLDAGSGHVKAVEERVIENKYRNPVSNLAQNVSAILWENLHPIIYPENLSDHYNSCCSSFFEERKCRNFKVANKRFKEGHCDV